MRTALCFSLLSGLFQGGIVHAAPLAAAAAPTVSSLKIPARHPFLRITEQDVARAKQRAANDADAKKILADLARRARATASTALGKLPGPDADEHRTIAYRLANVALGYAFGGEKATAVWVRDGLLAYADVYRTLPPLRPGRCRLHSSSLMEATWACNIVEAYDLVADSDVFAADQRRHVEQDLLREIAPAFIITDYQRDPRIKNLHFRMMFQTPLYTTFPDLSYAALGDSGRGPLRGDELVLVAWNRYRDPQLAWLLRSARQRHGWRGLVYDMPSNSPRQAAADATATWCDQGVGNSGVFRDGCTLLPASGVAVLRERSSDYTADRPEHGAERVGAHEQALTSAL